MSANRYQRHTLIDWFSQDDIRSKAICVVGAGAVGNEVIKNLTLLGVGTIHIFDFDKIESHNLARSVLFREDDIGQPKSLIATMRAKDLDPNVDIHSHVGDFWDLLTISKVRDFDVVFCCVDNFEARIKLNKICYLASVDLVNIGVDSRFGSVEVFAFSSSPNAGCYECALPLTVYDRIAQRYSCGWLKKISYVEKRVPTTTITASASASLAVSLGLRLGHSDNMAVSAHKVLIDTITGRSQISDVPRKPDCPCCGIFAPATAIFKASPVIDDRFLSDIKTADGKAPLWSSDPILVGYRVVGGSDESGFHIVFERASKYDDQFAKSISNDPDSVLVEIRDQFNLDDLQEHFWGRTVPAKFFVFVDGDKTIVVDLEGTSDG